MNKLVIKTTKKNYDLEENITENILQQKIKYKVFNVDNFSIYLDCFDNLDDFNIEYKLVEKKNIEEKKSGISKGLKIGLIVACVIFFIGIIASIARYCSRKNANSNLLNLTSKGAVFIP